jgi:hypothetical protein
MAKAKQVGSFGDIPQETFEAFYKAVEKLREEMIPRDCDGDSPIEVLIVNRMTHDPINYFAVPRNEVYSYITHDYLEVHPDMQQELDDETERALSDNVHMAANALDRYTRLKLMHNMDAREKKRPLYDRIIDACEGCKKGVGFESADKNGIYKTTREKYPDYPARLHTGDLTCGAFDLRRAEWETRHPEYRGKAPEPRWCMNPECRAKLPEYNSKKGKKDKNICVNSRCRLDNSKYYPEVAE